jgi:mRNA-degrading endonuclease YafQ of YafQ-DinJ toxin-antitoxin module
MNQHIKIKYSKRFQKQYSKLSPKLRSQFKARQRLWLNDPYNTQLHLHMLTAEYAGLYSINISGDIRALYEKIDDTYVVFGFIGTHNQLYG